MRVPWVSRSATANVPLSGAATVGRCRGGTQWAMSEAMWPTIAAATSGAAESLHPDAVSTSANQTVDPMTVSGRAMTIRPKVDAVVPRRMAPPRQRVTVSVCRVN